MAKANMSTPPGKAVPPATVVDHKIIQSSLSNKEASPERGGLRRLPQNLNLGKGRLFVRH